LTADQDIVGLLAKSDAEFENLGIKGVFLK
jgi:hypothetical protein